MYRLLCKEEDITHGQRMLMDIIDKRKLMELCRQKGLSFSYTYQVGIGGKTPPSPMVYTLRDIVHPVLWYYKESESLPEIKEYPADTSDSWNYQDSIGFYNLQKEAETTSLKEWSLRHGFDYSTIWFIAAGKRPPSYYKIKAFRDIIYPADWFYCL